MHPKELLYVAIGAVVLTNVSIIGTLFATGQLGGTEPEPPSLEEQAEKSETASPAVAPASVSRVNYLHTLADAMYLCEARLLEENSGSLKSFSYDHQASRYMEGRDIFFVFIELETVGTQDEPAQLGDIYCEVSPESKSIVSYQMVMREEM